MRTNRSTDNTASAYPESEGPFGPAFDPRLRSPFGAEAPDNPEYQEVPLTVECWVRLEPRREANVIVACGYEQPVHWNINSNRWMLLSAPETGCFQAYIEGGDPSTVETNARIADGVWHYVAMVYDEVGGRREAKKKRIRLYVDGNLVAESELLRRVAVNTGERDVTEGPLMVGSYRPRLMDCAGLIADVRVSRIARTIAGVPAGPLPADDWTVGLFRLSDLDETNHRFPDSSRSANHAYVPRVDVEAPSLNDWDRALFGVRTGPFEGTPALVEWHAAGDLVPQPEAVDSRSEGAEEIRLDGRWDCLEAPKHGFAESLMFDDEGWRGSFAACVPCTIQAALYSAGKIEDPMLLANNLSVQWVAEREWWLRRRFTVPGGWEGRRVRLLFDGVDYRATFWLNGRRLGAHEGMWGGPAFEVSDLLRIGGAPNEVVVRLDPAPPNYPDTFKNNVAYGWHYVRLITLGIWRSVRLQMRGDLEMQSPFLRAKAVNDDSVDVDLAVDVWNWGRARREATLDCSLASKTGDGHGFSMRRTVSLEAGQNRFGFRGSLSGARLWWPVDMGDPHLYQLRCVLTEGGRISDAYRANWGARVIETKPIENEPRADRYNWQLAVNGRDVWVKGANWCLPDALLRFTRKRLARFMELARHAHVQCFRVWGGGPAENDILYDLCDELGILVQQEFSMLGFHRLQNVPSLLATDMTHYMVPRLRNRPSLAIWAGANEIRGQGRIVEVLGRRILELDGTRPFHRSCPYGGDTHFHIYWNQRPLVYHHEAARKPFAFTEFGASSPADWETWKTVLPEEEWMRWPPREDSIFVHHTPTFVYDHVHLMNRYAEEYLAPRDLPSLIRGMQIAQSLADKFLIEGMRARKPETTMTHVYKLTENYPAASWATIDYYGRPKIAHYGLRDVYAPVHIMATFDSWDSHADRLPFEVHAVNDTSTPLDAEWRIRLYDGTLSLFVSRSDRVRLPIDRSVRIGEIEAAVPANTTRPLFLVLELWRGSAPADRNWYFFDFAGDQGCLFSRPRTEISAVLKKEGNRQVVSVENTGALPAISVEFDVGAASDTYYFEECGFWLEPGETREIEVHRTDPVEGEARPLGRVNVRAWNAESVEA